MRRVAFLLAAGVALFGCRRPPVPMGPPGPSGPPGLPGPKGGPGAPSPPKPKWSQAYDRACRGSITPPVLSPDGATVAFCSRLFETKQGQFVDAVPIGVAAVFGDGRILSNDYAGHWQLGLRGGAVDSSSEGSLGESAAISPSAERFVVVEDGEIVIREIPTLKETARIEIGRVWPHPIVGFLADERAVAFVPRDCVTKRGKDKTGAWTKTECASRKLMVVEGTELALLRDASDLRTIVFSGDGSRAVVERNNGDRAVISLPAGEAIVKLPKRDGAEDEFDREPMALNRGGSLVAYLDRGVVVAAIEGSTTTELAKLEGAAPDSLVFAPDAKTLYLANDERMIALREGAPERAIAMPRYDVKLPAGFVAFGASCSGEEDDRENPTIDGDDVCRERQRGLAAGYESLVSEGRSMLLPEGHVKAFFHKDEFTEVYVTAVDAAEFPEKDAAAWAKSVVRASVWLGARADDGVEKTIKMRGERAFDYAEFWREGCDPKDIYVSVFERDGLLYKVRIEVPPEHPQKDVAPLLKTFVDAPFASGNVAAHAFAKPPPAPDGPC